MIIRTGTFRPHQVHGKTLALLTAGGNGQQEHQHAHTAYPVGKAAPVQKALRQRLHIGEDRGTGSGKAGNGFKKGINKVGDLTGEEKGEPLYAY